MSIEEFPEFARHHWERIRSTLIEGSYRPAAVQRVLIAKAAGGERPLGIPTVLDRVIQQAVAQVIGPLFEPYFSAHSHGFRPQHSARMALAELEDAYHDGLRTVVDCDLESFFDTANHGLLMNRLAKHVGDKRVVRLIGRYLRAGVILPDRSRGQTPCGVPQGGPLSPLFARQNKKERSHALAAWSLRLAKQLQNGAHQIPPSLFRPVPGAEERGEGVRKWAGVSSSFANVTIHGTSPWHSRNEWSKSIRKW